MVFVYLDSLSIVSAMCRKT